MVKVTKSDMCLVVEKGIYGHSVVDNKSTPEAAISVAEGFASDTEQCKEDCVMLVYELVRVVKKVTKLTAVKPEFK